MAAQEGGMGKSRKNIQKRQRVGRHDEREEEEGGEQQREKSVSEGWGESVGRGGRAGVAWRPRKEEWVRAE